MSTTITPEGLLIHYRNAGYQFEKIGDAEFPITTHATRIYDKGAPDLEKLSLSIPVEDVKGAVKIEVRNVTQHIRKGYIAPSIGLVTQDELHQPRIEGLAYQQAIYPEKTLSSRGRHQIGAQAFETFWLYLQHYHPQTQTLDILLECDILIKGDFQKHLAKDEPDEEKYLTIIAPDSLHATLSPFITWKNQLGFTTTLASSSEYDSQAKIKAYLKSQYESDQLDYAIMVGLKHQTPFDQSSFGLGDYAYGRVSGNDQFAEVAVGRFPAETKEKLALLIEKTIKYEQGGIGATWFTNMASAASDEGGSIGDKGETDFEHLSGINTRFNQNGFSSNIVHQGASNNPHIGELINAGCGYFFYAGHGVESSWQSTRFTLDSVRALQNQTHPVMINAACLNANFNKVPNLAYEFMCASHEGTPAGFTAMLSSSITQLWAPPMLGQDVFVDQLFHGNGQQKILGDLILQAEYDVMNNYGYGGIETVYTWVLCGDPSLRLWTKTPQTISATIPEVFDITSDEFTVQGPENALVTIVHQGQLLDQQCIQNGQAILNRGGVVISDSVTVTLTLADHLPLVQKLAPYNNGAAFYNIATLETTARPDQRIENDTWSGVDIEIWNLGDINGEEIRVYISSPGGKALLSDTAFVLPQIEGGTSYLLDSLDIRTSQFFPDEESISVSVTVEDNLGQTNTNTFDLEVAAPELSEPMLLLNGDAFPTESPVNFEDTATIEIVMLNSGHADSDSISVAFILSDVFAEVISETEGSLVIPAKSADTLRFSATFDSQTPGGHLFEGTLLLPSSDSNHFSFYHLSKPELVIGNQDFAVAEYPFYNYYKSAKSQFIYLREELGLDSKIIDSLAVNIQQHPFLSNQTSLKNFSIRMAHTDLDTIDGQFTDLNESSEVFYAETLELPQTQGWFYFDIEDFYYSGEDHVMLEFSWGRNAYTTNYNSSFRVYAHQAAHDLGIFGYSDGTGEVPVVETTRNRPDLKVSEIPSELYTVNIFYQDVGKEFTTDSLGVQIGGKQFTLYLSDYKELVLPKGTFHYQVFNLSNHSVFLDSAFTVAENDQWINISGSEPISGLSEVEQNLYWHQSHDKVSIRHNETFSYRVTNAQGIILHQDLNRSNTHEIPLRFSTSMLIITLFFDDEIVSKKLVSFY